MMLDTLIATLQEKRADLGNVDVIVSSDYSANLIEGIDGTGEYVAGYPISTMTIVRAKDKEMLLISGPNELEGH